MSTTIKPLTHLIVLLVLVQCAICSAQSDDTDDQAEQAPGRFLLDLSYTSTDSVEGVIDVFLPGFTWLIRPDLRVGGTMTYVFFDPSVKAELNIETISSNHGLGDSTFYLQYDWGERLTASPWIPDNVGTVVTVLAPTGKAQDYLGSDTWAASLSTSWPILIKKKWLLNPAIAYLFSFNEGPLAENLNVAEVGLGIVRLFPSKFWISYTPSAWYDFDDKGWNYDSHIAVGKMFSNGMGIGLDYGRTTRHTFIPGRDDRNILINFFYQFGQ